jgi:hypothetical protein
MNPLGWRREQQLALVLGAILGAVIFLVVGFMYRGINYTLLSGGEFWFKSTARCAILGALVGACLVYIRQLLHAP